MSRNYLFMRKIQCFVACAFWKKDVDEVYSKVIKKVLKELKITVQRVDKINHNKNIDLKIIELIKSCDFCIADLTYARPSVYYEAGRLHGLGKEVIFTARQDHFNPKEHDREGNFKIHFDLVTKNIIGWNKPNQDFKKKLKDRIKLVIEPILRKLKEESQNKYSESDFKKNSLAKKIEIIKYIALSKIKDKGYNIYKEYDDIFYARKTNNFKKIIWCIVSNNFAQKDIELFRTFHFSNFFSGNKRLLYNTGDSLTVIFLSLGSTPENRIEKSLPTFQKVSETKEYHHGESYKIKEFRYIFIDKIASELDLNKKLESIKRI